MLRRYKYPQNNSRIYSRANVFSCTGTRSAASRFAGVGRKSSNQIKRAKDDREERASSSDVANFGEISTRRRGSNYGVEGFIENYLFQKRERKFSSRDENPSAARMTCRALEAMFLHPSGRNFMRSKGKTSDGRNLWSPGRNTRNARRETPVKRRGPHCGAMGRGGEGGGPLVRDTEPA